MFSTAPVLPPGKFHGLVSHAFRLPDVTLVETRYPNGEVLPPHAHQRPYICAVLKGSFEENSGGARRRCRASTILFRSAGETHSDRFGPAGATCLNVELAEGFVDRLNPCANLLAQPMQLEGGAAWLLALRLGREYRSPDAVTPLAIECLVQEMLLGVWRQKDARAESSPWLRQARELLHDRFRERLALSEIAATVGVHPVHLARQFRRCFGFSVGEYQRRLRIEFVCRQVVAGRGSLATLAVESGFADQSHLTRSFQKLLGITPGVFARRAR